MSARPAPWRRRAASVLEERTAELRATDVVSWEVFQDLPFELWPDAALRSYVAGIDSWSSALDADAPTAVQLRTVIRATAGCDVSPSAEDLQ